jgi:hypothetical protein
MTPHRHSHFGNSDLAWFFRIGGAATPWAIGIGTILYCHFVFFPRPITFWWDELDLLPALLVNGAERIFSARNDHFIPFSFLMFRTEYLLFGLEYSRYQQTLFVLNGLNAGFMFLFLRKVSTPFYGGIGAVTFATSSQYWRSMVMGVEITRLFCLAFLLTALLAWHRYREEKSSGPLLASGLASFLAPCSSGEGVLVAPLVLLFDRLVLSGTREEDQTRKQGYLVIGLTWGFYVGLYFLARWNDWKAGGLPTLEPATIIRFALYGPVLGAAVPFLRYVVSPSFYPGIVLLYLLALIAVSRLISARERGLFWWGQVTLFLLFVLLAFARFDVGDPSVNRHWVGLAGRYQYIPLVGVTAALVAALKGILQRFRPEGHRFGLALALTLFVAGNAWLARGHIPIALAREGRYAHAEFAKRVWERIGTPLSNGTLDGKDVYDLKLPREMHPDGTIALLLQIQFGSKPLPKLSENLTQGSLRVYLQDEKLKSAMCRWHLLDRTKTEINACGPSSF